MNGRSVKWPREMHTKQQDVHHNTLYTAIFYHLIVWIMWYDTGVIYLRAKTNLLCASFEANHRWVSNNKCLPHRHLSGKEGERGQVWKLFAVLCGVLQSFLLGLLLLYNRVLLWPGLGVAARIRQLKKRERGEWNDNLIKVEWLFGKVLPRAR